MIETDRLIFLQLQKTGCSHVEKVLINDLHAQRSGLKHYPIPKRYPTSGRRVLGGVRNPWDWYVSYWSYGCAGHGGITYHYLTEPVSILRRLRNHRLRTFPWMRLPYKMPRFIYGELTRPSELWKRHYADRNNHQAFRDWMKLLLSEARRFDSAIDYGFSALPEQAGLFTYLYLYLYLRDNNVLFNSGFKINSLKGNLDSQLIIDDFLCQESLDQNLVETLVRSGYPDIGLKLAKEKRRQKTNTSNRKSDYRVYYDDETAELVGRMEKLIIDKHGYSF